jgi:hypothetical protein
MEKFFSKINQVMKASLPYTALLAVILGFINLGLIKKAQSDIDYIDIRMNDIESAVQDINADFDNTDVINSIEDACYSIVSRIEDAESSIERTVRLWSN